MAMDNLERQVQRILEPLQEVPPRDPKRAQAGKEAFLTLARELRPEERAGFAQHLWAWVVPFRLWRRLQEWITIPHLEVQPMSVLAFIAIVVTFLVGGTVTVRAADASVPGDSLYAVDVAVEQVQLAFTRSPEKRAQLLSRLAQERLNEIQVLESQGRVDQIPVAVQRLNQHLSQMETAVAQVPATQRAEIVQQVRQIYQASRQVLQAAVTPTTPPPDSTPTPIAETGTPTPEPTPVSTAPAATIEFVGVVESMGSDQWVIDGKTVLVAGAEIKDFIQEGDVVRVEAVDNGDGTYTALEIELVDDDDVTGTKVKFVGVVESMGSDQWVIDGKTVLVAGAEIKDFIQEGDVVRVEAVDNGDGTYTALEIELVDDDDVTGTKVKFVGVVESMGSDQWVIDGKTVLVAGAEIKDFIQEGDVVRVEAVDNGDGTYTALEIELVDDDDEESEDISDSDDIGDDDSNQDSTDDSDDVSGDSPDDDGNSSGGSDDDGNSSGGSDDDGNSSGGSDDDDDDDDDDDEDDDD